MLLCNLHCMNATRRIISLPNHGRQRATSLQCLSDSSRPFSLTRSYFNLHTFSSTTTTMNSIPQSTTRLGLSPLGHSIPFRAPLLKRCSQFYARPGRVGAPHLSCFDVADSPTLTDVPNPPERVSELRLYTSPIVLPPPLPSKLLRRLLGT